MFKVQGKRLASLAASALVCAAAIIPTPASALTVNLAGTTANTCTYSAISVDPSGNVTITCQGGGPVIGPGTVAFTASSYPAVVTGASFTVMVSRTNGSTGAQTATVSANSACALTNGALSWNDNDTGTKSVTVTAGAFPGSCGLSLTTSANLGMSTTSITVNASGGAGSLSFSAATYATANTNSTFVANVVRSGGSTGTASVIVTGSGSCTTSGATTSWNSGDSADKPVTINTTSAGTCTIALTNVNGATVGTQSTATAQVAVPTVPGCSTTPAGTLSGQFGGQGAWQQPMLASTSIIAFPLPTVPSPSTAALITLSQTANTPSPLKIELAISPCPGDFEWGKTNQKLYGITPCYQETTNPSGLDVKWNTVARNYFNRCDAVPSLGPWYVSLRLTYPSCPFGGCGMSIQWNLLN